MYNFQVFDRRSLWSLTCIQLSVGVSNINLRQKVLGKCGKSVHYVTNLHRLKWLECFLCMYDHHLPRRTNLTGGWLKRATGDQTKTWGHSINSLVGADYLIVGHIIIAETQQIPTDMAQNHSHCRKCNHILSFSRCHVPQSPCTHPCFILSCCTWQLC